MLVPARGEHMLTSSRKVGITMGVVWREKSGGSPRWAAKQGGDGEKGEGGHWLIDAPNAFLELRSTAMSSEALQGILGVLRD